MTDPRLSVVIPTYRRPELLDAGLTALAAQDAAPDSFEVIVVDDGSGDATGEVLARPRDLRLTALTQPGNAGPAAARNRGVREAKGELILFLDDDVVAPPALVGQHLAFHAERADRTLGLLGRVDWLPGLEVTPFMEWLDRSGLQFAFETWLQPGRVAHPAAAFYTANLSMSRALILEVGGFDERFPYAAYEDIELAWRLARVGFELEYRPDVLGYHSRTIDLATFASRMGRAAKSAEIMLEVQPDFPVDHGLPEAGLTSGPKLTALRAAAPLARRLGRRGVLDRYYAAVVAREYRSARRSLAAGTGAGPGPAGERAGP